MNKQKIKILTILISTFVIFVAAPVVIHGAVATAHMSSHTVILDGVQVTPTAFNIDGNNFFMLRDMAYLLNGTNAQFDIIWDESLNAINLLTGSVYTITGSEMSQGMTEQATATPTTAAVYANGVRVNVTAFNIGGNNFFMLRDLADILNFNVDWDGVAQAVIISTSASPTMPAGPIPDYITIGNRQISTSLTTLSIPNVFGLTNEDIVPLRYMVNLTSLEIASVPLYGNHITDLWPIAGLTNLTDLTIARVGLSDISPLAGLTNLRYLDLSSNGEISDLTALAGLRNLTNLDLRVNNISNLMPLAGLTNLTEIIIHGNQISDISPLAGLTNLTRLELSQNQIPNGQLHFLSGLTNLTFLGLSGNGISDLSFMANLTNLTSVTFSGNQISDLSPIANLTGLRFMDFSHNQISDLRPFEGFTNVVNLFLENNLITDWTPVRHIRIVGGRHASQR